MVVRLLNIGYGNSVPANKVLATVSPESAPIKKIIKESKKRGTLIDVTHGRKIKSVIITNCNYVVLSAVNIETIKNRIRNIV